RAFEGEAMNSPQVDGVLVRWGERLFYPANRIVKSLPTPRLDTLMRRKGAVIRQRIEATVRRASQVMVKVTGGGRGVAAIAAHFRYISKNGRLDIEDDREVVRNGGDRELAMRLSSFVRGSPVFKEAEIRRRQQGTRVHPELVLARVTDRSK
ncbi:MAG TPA: conjugal transfer protein TraS, partial [Roseateles sp.]